MVMERIFFNGTISVIEIEKFHPVNEEFSIFIQMLQIITSILILVLVIPALYKFYSPKVTFINFLVILDCLDAIGHVPILLQLHWRIVSDESVCFFEAAYNLAMMTLNRGIPFAIAVFRYCCVFHDSTIRDQRKKIIIQTILMGFLAFSVVINLLIFIANPNSIQRFEVCMGREEAYEYNFEDFYIKKDLGPATNISLSMRWVLYFSHLLTYIIVPFCYTKIFIYRRNHVMPGQGKHHEEQVKKRKKRNNVTYASNMIVWMVECLATLLVFVVLSLVRNNKTLNAIMKILYVFITCGMSSIIYIMD